jgi:Flp pilus assembly protein TadD
MMPVLLIALLIVVLPFPAHAAKRGDIFRQAKAATALVVAVNDNTHSVSLGSGFFVNPEGLLITNAHVIEDRTRLFLYVQDQAVYAEPEVVAVDADKDLAALRIRHHGVVAVALSANIPTEGAEVIAVGYPRASDLLEVGFTLHSSIAMGVVSGVVQHRSTAKDHIASFIVVTGVMNSGNSGGPLVQTDSGEVVGMVVTAVPYQEPAKDRKGNVIGSVKLRSGLSYSIPAPVIREWLASQRLESQLKATPFDSGVLQGLGHGRQADRSFATGHLLHTMGMVLHQDSDLLSLAVSHYKAAAAVQPDMTSLYRNLGLAYGALGRWEEALQAHQKAAVQTPDDAALLTDMGLAWKKTGQWERAADSYRAALRVNPRFSLARNNLGTLLWERGRLEDAIGEYRQALEIEPTVPIVAYNLGLALEAKGKREDAVYIWESFLLKTKPEPDSEGWIIKIRNAVTRLRPQPLPAAAGSPAIAVVSPIKEKKE